MSDAPLSRQRCWTHPAREAAARCPSCARFYCRECVTEHEGRLLCAACLRAALGPAPVAREPGRALAALTQALQLTAGLAVAWLFFYLLAQSLVSIPSAVHEGTLWMDQFMESQAD